MNLNEKKDLKIFIDSLSKLYIGRFLILKSTLVFLIIGILYSLSIENKYRSSLVFSLSLNSESNSASNLSELASFAGINLNTQNDKIISPSSYNVIMSDVKFKNRVLEIKLNDSTNLKSYLAKEKQSYLSLFKEYSINLPFTIINYFRNNKGYLSSSSNYLDSDLFISKENYILYGKLDKIINLSLDKRTNLIKLSVIMNNPIYSSIIATKTFEILQDIVINFNIQSAKEKLDFNQNNYNIKKVEFDNIQKKLAEFQDNNQVISTNKFNSKLFVLQNEFNLINSVFMEISKQLELSKIQISKETPVFIILDNAEVPNLKESPKRTRLVIGFVFLGIILSLSILLFKDFIFKTLKFLKSLK